MELALHQIDAFADELFSGNPAAVMPLEEWLEDDLLRRLAEENHCSETAFYRSVLPPEAGAPPAGTPAYHLRWFSPAVEVELCGHATLATAGQLFADVHPDAERLAFWTRSGWLAAERAGADAVRLDFPANPPRPIDLDGRVAAAIGTEPLEAAASSDLLLVLDDAAAVTAVRPDLALVTELEYRGVIVTAAGDPDGVDFVSRLFAPRIGIDEDPVTGSAHTELAPFWGGRLGKQALVGRQLSARGGTVRCELRGDRVALTGSWRRYLRGTVELTIPGR